MAKVTEDPAPVNITDDQMLFYRNALDGLKADVANMPDTNGDVDLRGDKRRAVQLADSLIGTVANLRKLAS